MTHEFWRGRRVIVTGHTGFKGSWLCLWLHALGADVVGYALPPADDRGLYVQADVASTLSSVVGDVRDLDHLHRVVAEHRPEVVLHLAAQSLVRQSYREPADTYATNVLGTVNVLEAIRRARSSTAVVCITSDKCYENRETERPYVEGDPMGGSDPYSSSKGAAELVVAAYRRSYFAPERFTEHGVALSSARAGNVIGGGDWGADRLVVDVVASCLRGEPPLIRNPTAVRPWQFVLEPLVGYLTLAELSSSAPGRYAEGWNFGPKLADCRPVGWVVDRITSVWGSGLGWTLDDGPREHEAQLLLLDASKARDQLGWQPRLDLEGAIDWTVAWYRAFQGGEDLRAFTERQIASFESLDGG